MNVCAKTDTDSQLNMASIHLGTKSARVATGMLQVDHPMPCKDL